jgi:hypothetical protein
VKNEKPGLNHEGNAEHENNGYIVFKKKKRSARKKSGGVRFCSARLNPFLQYRWLLDKYLKTT